MHTTELERMSLWHDLERNREYMTRDGKYYVADGVLMNMSLEQLKTIDELTTENHKLRELVDAWMGCGTRYHTMKGACPMFDENAKDFCKAEKMARELGIEVPEWADHQ